MSKVLKLEKGKTFNYLGKTYKVPRSTRLSVFDVTTDQTVQGEHKSDHNPNSIKERISSMLKDQIRFLENKEYNALFDIAEDDPLFPNDGVEEYDKITISEQLGRVEAINYLKDFLKQIKAV